MRNLWKQVRYRLEYVGLCALAEAIPRLSRRASLRLARVLGALYYRIDGKGRAVALENLRLSFGDTLDARRREAVARASYLNFARGMLDLFWARNLTPANFTDYIKVENLTTLLDAHAEHRGVILLALHFGSHEWVSLASGFVGVPSSMVALDFKNPALDAVFGRAREHSGNRIVGQRQSMLRLLRAVLRGGAAGLLIDLALRLDQPGEVIDAFGMKMHVTFLHALLHARTGVPLVPVTNVPHLDGTCTVTVHPPLTFAAGMSHQAMAQACWDFFAPFILARPDLWLWNYKHWRYRPRDAAREYPFYSHVAKKFERILAGEQPTVPAAANLPPTSG